jgi:acyl-CoA thioester hydrolase
MDLEGINFKITTNIQIRFNDIDGLGHVNNSVYSQYFDQGRMQYFTHLNNGEDVDWHEARLIIASTHIDFIKPVFLNEPIEVHTAVYKLGNKSLKMIQKLINTSTGELKATCKSVMVGFDPVLSEAIVLPPNWRQAIAAFDDLE